MGEFDRLYAGAQGAWPEFVLARSTFHRAVERVQRQCAIGVDDIGAAELYLVHACALQVPAALRRFEQRYIRPLDRTMIRVIQRRSELDEVKQELRIRLFVPKDDAEPRIVSYAGRGRLGGLVQVVATRIALNLQRRHEPRPDGSEQLIHALDDPELDQLRADELSVFKASFEAAVADCTPRARTLLRLHLLDGLSIDEIAPIYAVHRSTAARWLALAREGVTERTRAGLRARLGPESTPLRRLLHVLHSRLDLSLSRVLRSGAEVDQSSSQVGASSRH